MKSGDSFPHWDLTKWVPGKGWVHGRDTGWVDYLGSKKKAGSSHLAMTNEAIWIQCCENTGGDELKKKKQRKLNLVMHHEPKRDGRPRRCSSSISLFFRFIGLVELREHQLLCSPGHTIWLPTGMDFIITYTFTLWGCAHWSWEAPGLSTGLCQVEKSAKAISVQSVL